LFLIGKELMDERIKSDLDLQSYINKYRPNSNS